VQVFLATKNQIRARTISRGILRTIATKRCMVWLSGSFFNPRSNIKRDKRTMDEKHNVKTAISLN
jgi:hypothetical protein